MTGSKFRKFSQHSFGDNARGLQIVNTRHALRNLKWPEETVLAQQYLANDGYDIKLFEGV